MSSKPVKKPTITKETYTKKITTPSGSRIIKEKKTTVYRDTKTGKFTNQKK